MSIDEIVSMLVNNTAPIACLAYFMYRDSKFITNIEKTLVSLVDAISVIKELLEKDKLGGTPNGI